VLTNGIGLLLISSAGVTALLVPFAAAPSTLTYAAHFTLEPMVMLAARSWLAMAVRVPTILEAVQVRQPLPPQRHVVALPVPVVMVPTVQLLVVPSMVQSVRPDSNPPLSTRFVPLRVELLVELVPQTEVGVGDADEYEDVLEGMEDVLL